MGRFRDGVRPVQSQLEAYCAQLRSKIGLRSVVVFGSRARGDHWENSDIDLLVVADDFRGMGSGNRIDLLLEAWSGIPALEPFGVTPEECMGPGWLLLWDALHQGRVLEDDGTFRSARESLLRRIDEGNLVPTPSGWRERLVDKGRSARI